MKSFQGGQPRPESTKINTGQPNDRINDQQNDQHIANQTSQQSAGGDGGAANKASITEPGGFSDQANAKMPTAAAAAAKASPQAQQAQVASQSAISQAAVGKRLGAKFVVPGESGNRYYLGLASTIEALGAKTQMEVYLAEKIFTCIWSMNRYEAQKRASLIAEMVTALKDGYLEKSDTKLALTQLLEDGRWDEPALKKVMQHKGFTESSLTQRAMERRMKEIIQLDEAIAVKAHTLKAMQKSYEAFACRSILQERLKLQNDLLKRDLQAIDVQVLDRNSEKGNSEKGNSEKGNSYHCADGIADEAVDDAQDKTEIFKGKPKLKGKPKRLVRQSTIAASTLNVDSQNESLRHGLGEGLAPKDVKPRDVKPSEVTPSEESPNEVTPKVTPVHRERKTKPSGRSPERL